MNKYQIKRNEVRNMILKLNTNLIPLFTGTYENIWEVSEELNAMYDRNEFMKSIVRAYKANEAMIVREIDLSFVKSIKFTGKYYSPRYYNFSTDTLDFNLNVDKKKLYKILDRLSKDTKFDAWLKENFSHRSGFISFTPNNYKDLATQIKTEGDEFEQSIGAMIQYLLLDEESKLSQIETEIYEDWSGNGYYGLNYTLACDYCEVENVEWDHKCNMTA